jgi:hypothetical protein
MEGRRRPFVRQIFLQVGDVLALMLKLPLMVPELGHAIFDCSPLCQFGLREFLALVLLPFELGKLSLVRQAGLADLKPSLNSWLGWDTQYIAVVHLFNEPNIDLVLLHHEADHGEVGAPRRRAEKNLAFLWHRTRRLFLVLVFVAL